MRGLGSWRQIRLWWALIIFLLTLAILLGGQGLAEKLRIDRPLAQELGSVAGIESFHLEQRADGTCLELRLGRVADLRRVATQAISIVERRHKQPVVEIVVRDRRQGLEGAYYELRFDLEEAMATGGYTKLRSGLDELAREYRLDKARVYLDSRFIYVQLEKDAGYLYEALPRPEPARYNAGQGGGM